MGLLIDESLRCGGDSNIGEKDGRLAIVTISRVAERVTIGAVSHDKLVPSALLVLSYKCLLVAIAIYYVFDPH